MITPIYQELSETLEQYIADNGITGKMPGVLKLSRELGVHHVTLSKAMHILEKKGLLSINGTKGTFVVEKNRRPKYHVIALVGVNAEQSESKEILAYLNRIAGEAGYSVIGITFESELFQKNRALLLNFPVDGFLFRMSSLRNEQAELLRKERIPMVSGARRNEDWLDMTDCDHEVGYGILLDRLMDLGHRRIAFIEFDRTPEYRFYLNHIRRIFQQKLKDDFDPELFYTKIQGRDLWLQYGEKYWEIHTRKALNHFYAQRVPPSAIIAPYPFAFRARERLEMEWKLSVPNDCSIAFVSHATQYGNFEGMDGISYDEYEMLNWAIRRLLDRIDGKAESVERFFLKPSLIHGNTIGRRKEE